MSNQTSDFDSQCSLGPAHQTFFPPSENEQVADLQRVATVRGFTVSLTYVVHSFRICLGIPVLGRHGFCPSMDQG